MSALVKHSYYEAVNQHTIIINSIVLMLADPSLDDHYGKRVIESLNIWCSVIFIIEVVLKVIAMGLFKSKHSYLKSDGFNVFDFILASAIITSLIFEGIYSGDKEEMLRYNGLITAIKALKAIRPLRLARSPALRDTVSSVFGAIPSLGNAAMINFLFIYIFSILGV